MSIDPLKVDRAAVQQTVATQDEAKGASRDREPGAGELAGDQVLLTAMRDGGFNQRLLRHEQDNALAGAVHQSDRALQQLSQKIDALKEPLDTIVKNFPPFAPEDKARMELLRSYFSLRKEIDRLTIPPPPEIAQARRSPELPPALAPSADDSQIADHLAKLDASAAALSDRRAQLVADTLLFLQQGRFQEPFRSPAGGRNAAFPVLSESAAVQKSVQIGRQFASSVSQGVALDHSKFLKGLS